MNKMVTRRSFVAGVTIILAGCTSSSDRENEDGEPEIITDCDMGCEYIKNIDAVWSSGGMSASYWRVGVELTQRLESFEVEVTGYYNGSMSRSTTEEGSGRTHTIEEREVSRVDEVVVSIYTEE